METKICSKCKVEKPLSEYTKDKHKKDGLRPDCKSCRKEYIENNKLIITQRLKISYIKDKEKRLEYSKKSYKKNQLFKQKYAVNYYNDNKVKINNYRRNKKSIDPIYKLRSNMSIRLNHFLKTKKLRKNNTTFNIIGCTPTFLKSYLEDLFTEGMSWNNHGLFGWHIDHKIPLSSAQTEEEILKLCHYTNLQPLWAIDNLSKGKQIIN